MTSIRRHPKAAGQISHHYALSVYKIMRNSGYQGFTDKIEFLEKLLSVDEIYQNWLKTQEQHEARFSSVKEGIERSRRAAWQRFSAERPVAEERGDPTEANENEREHFGRGFMWVRNLIRFAKTIGSAPFGRG